MADRILAVLLLASLWGTPVHAAPKAAKTQPAAKSEPPAAKELAEAREQVRGCDPRATSSGVVFQCEWMIAAVAEKRDTPAALQEELLGMVRALGGEFAQSEQLVTVGKKVLSGAGFEVHDGADHKLSLRGKAVSLPLDGGVARAAICFNTKPSEISGEVCDKLLSALGRVGPAPFAATIVPLAGSPEFLGRKLAVPDGCRTVSSDAMSFRIDCKEGASLFYSRARNRDLADLLADRLRDGFLKNGIAAPDRPCVLDGAPTTCRVVDAQGASYYIATAQIQQDAVITVCSQSSNWVESNPLCAQVLSF